MKANRNRTIIISTAATAMLGLAIISLAGCSSGESPSAQVTQGGSAALQGPIVFVNNTGDRSLTTVALRGDSGNAKLGDISAATFGDIALGDMQFSSGEWVFVNVSGTNNGANNGQNVGTKVATIDPINSATPVHVTNLTTGTRPVHIYRDTTDGEVIWSMNDTVTVNTTTPGDDTVNCNVATRPGGPVEGGSVTIIHNSHQGPGAHPPEVEATVCVLADGHKVTAFSQPTAANAAILKRAFVSSETAGEVAVVDNEPGSPTKWQMIRRIDLCDPAREATQTSPATCNSENPTGATAFTPNNARPHGIRWSKLTGKVYSIQEGYGEIAEIDPTTFTVTPIFTLTGTPYTSFGISPDGRFLLLRGQTTAPDPQATKLGVLDLSVTPAVRTDFTIAALDGTSPGSFKFSPDGKRFYILAGTAATATKRNVLFAFDSSKLVPVAPATVPDLTLPLNGEIALLQTGGHSIDVLAEGASEAGEAKYIVVSNTGTPGTVSIVNATTNTRTQDVSVGPAPGAVMVYYPGAASAGNQATSSLTGGQKAKPALLPERLDDHGMPE
ncbi:MAG TPA: hypothetical protein VJT11_09370 [Nitrospiraceae bacterium]|nr:hypothetical protein [Nitrospiraceae bacterium]